MSLTATAARAPTAIAERMRSAMRPNYKLLSLLVFILLWQAVALASPSALLPGPVQTFQAFLENLANGSLLQNLSVTIRRVAVGFALSMVIGAMIGIAMGLWKVSEDLFSYPVLILLSIPSLGYVILGLMWFGINEMASIFVITAIGFPPITFNVYEGVKNLDMSLVDMSRAFRASQRKIITDLVLPSLVPYFMAGARYGIGLAWKIAIIAEMMGMGNGVGFAMQYYYRLLRMDQVLAWILVFTLVIIVVDRLLLQQIEHRLTRWRRPVLL
jgi:NitT/TauT family transport system permease protein